MVQVSSTPPIRRGWPSPTFWRKPSSFGLQARLQSSDFSTQCRWSEAPNICHPFMRKPVVMLNKWVWYGSRRICMHQKDLDSHLHSHSEGGKRKLPYFGIHLLWRQVGERWRTVAVCNNPFFFAPCRRFVLVDVTGLTRQSQICRFPYEIIAESYDCCVDAVDHLWWGLWQVQGGGEWISWTEALLAQRILFQNLELLQDVEFIQQLTAVRIDEEMADDLWSIRFNIIKEWQAWKFGDPLAGKDVHFESNGYDVVQLTTWKCSGDECSSAGPTLLSLCWSRWNVGSTQ